MSSSSRTLDAFASIIDIQLLAIENTLMSMNNICNFSSKHEVQRIITNCSSEIRQYVKKLQLKTDVQHGNRFDASSSRQQLLVLPSVRSPVSRRQKSSTNLSPSKRWETFLDEKGIQDYVSIPVKRMVATLDHWNRQSKLATAFNKWRVRLLNNHTDFSNKSVSIRSYNNSYGSFSSTEAKQLQLESDELSPYSDRYASFEADEFLLHEPNINEDEVTSGFHSPEFAYEAALYNALDGLPMQLEDAMFSAWELQQSKSDAPAIPPVVATVADKKLGLMEENRRTEIESLMLSTVTSRPTNQQYQIVKESQRIQQEDDDLSVGFELPP